MKKYNKKEIINLLIWFEVNCKVKKVVMKKDFGKILCDKFDEHHSIYNNFNQRYENKEVYVFKDFNDWFILEDNNFVITEDCWEELS